MAKSERLRWDCEYGESPTGGDVFKYACFCAKFSGIMHKKLFIEGINGRVRTWLREK